MRAKNTVISLFALILMVVLLKWFFYVKFGEIEHGLKASVSLDSHGYQPHNVKIVKIGVGNEEIK